ncbi:hypothetical protein PR202_ga13091 [Eleusine coracana subsp. coracana]|uniref:Glycosyltransferase N-terminal domain-containing protein n=1 Tax=Eleusine coracana subsp. coracana TaxID=191504 RepID=A0AAV5CDM5_ELECO|nr:hypothetical protein PR202_ga13091 [Eleusine coracana subsp. coracana]
MSQEATTIMTAHVLVVPFPGQGHMNPMLHFAKALASRGVATTFVTTLFVARTAGVDAAPASVATISDGHDEGGFASAASVGEYLVKQRAAAAASLAALVEASSREKKPFTCIVYDAFEQSVPPVAARMGVPAVPFSTQSCAVSAVYHYVSQGRLAVPPLTGKSEAIEGLPEMERVEFPSFVFSDGPYPMLTELALNQFAHVGKDDWVLFNSFEELESEVSSDCFWKQGLLLPRPLKRPTEHKEYNKTKNKKRKNSFLFASLGAAQTEELARGLLATGNPFLWVVKATEEAHLPLDILDEAKASGAALIVRWSPQLEVLAHPAVGCFLTHCGWNSTLAALSFGVPMVALGLWTDQPMNALNIERAWAAGVRARRDAATGMFLRGEVERCVRAVMDDGEGARAVRAAARKWRDQARAAVAPGGSSDRNMDEFVKLVRAGPRKVMMLEGRETLQGPRHDDSVIV